MFMNRTISAVRHCPRSFPAGIVGGLSAGDEKMRPKGEFRFGGWGDDHLPRLALPDIPKPRKLLSETY